MITQHHHLNKKSITETVWEGVPADLALPALAAYHPALRSGTDIQK
tara:strand:- start:179 stop:316 length:138 start_codon:yes stop_codon:yes gene_type:complete